MMTKKILSLLLALLMIACCFVGCKKEEAAEEEGAKTTVSSNASAEKGNYDTELDPNLHFDDEEVTIISRDALGQSDEFYFDKTTGDIVADAIWSRNVTVQEMLGVKLNVVNVKDDTANNHATVAVTLRTDIQSGNGEYEIAALPQYTAHSLTLEGMYTDLRSMPHLNLDKYYWAQNYNEWQEFKGSQYTATGMMALSLYRFMYITVYNNGFFTDHGLDDIYQLVIKNEWTAEKQYEMSANLYSDDGEVPGEKDKKDTYGFISGARTTVDAYLEAWNLNSLSRDTDGNYVYKENVDKLSNIASGMLHMFFDNAGAYIVPTGRDNTDNADILEVFKNGKSAMATMKVNTLETGLRDATFEYSIAPLPKFNKNQKAYGTYVQDQFTIVVVPTTVAGNEKTMEVVGATLEALASESYKQTYKAYFETALSYQYLQNKESVEMLQLIYESVDFQFMTTALTTTVGFNVILRNVASSEFNTVSHQLATYKNAGEFVETYNEDMTNLINGLLVV